MRGVGEGRMRGWGKEDERCAVSEMGEKDGVR